MEEEEQKQTEEKPAEEIEKKPVEEEKEEEVPPEEDEERKALMRLVWLNTNLLIISILISVNALLAIWLKIFIFQVLGLLMSCGAIFYFWNKLHSKIEPLLK